MKVSVLPKEKITGMSTILVEDNPWRVIHNTIFGYKPEFSKSYDTLEELEKHFNTLEYNCARRYVLYRLSAKSYHSIELTKALKQRLVSSGNITKVISEFLTKSYFNDPEWIESFIRSQKTKNNGPQAIRMKLLRKGISEIDFCNHLHGEIGSQQVQITKLLNTKYRSKDLKKFEERRKVIASLARRGFEFSEISKCITNLNNNTEEYYYDFNEDN